MISVQSLRQLLSGNKLLFGLIVLAGLFISSCSTPAIVTAPVKSEPKAEEKPEVYNPATKKYEKANPQNTSVDTVVWRDTGDPLITDNNSVNARSGSSNTDYKISLLLPLSEEDLHKDLTAEGTEKYFHYYAGVKMAVDKISAPGANFVVNVFDIKASQDAIRPVLNHEFVKQSDLIIGPLRRDHLNETARMSKERNIPLVAPWNSFRTIENINPNYILLKSSLPTHCEVLTQYVLKNFKASDVALLGREKNKNLINFLQTELKKPQGNNMLVIPQITVKDDYKFGEEYKYMDTTKSVYIVAEFEDPDVVFHFLRHINIMRKSRDITVIGMPSWQDYGRDYNSLFSQLKVTISASSFVDGGQPEVSEFKNEFFRQFQIFPLKEAYEGYDGMKYLIEMLLKYGRKFHAQGDSNTYQGLASIIRLEKIIDTSKPIDDRLLDNNVQCIENKALHILKFDQFRFSKIH